MFWFIIIQTIIIIVLSLCLWLKGNAIFEAFENCGMTAENWEIICSEEKLIKKASELMLSEIKIIQEHPVVVNYALSLEEMIAACKFDRRDVDDNINKIPLSSRWGEVKTTFTLVHYGPAVVNKNVIEYLERENMQPANLEELLAFGAEYPDEQKKYSIVALGSLGYEKGEMVNYELAPYLGRRGVGVQKSWRDSSSLFGTKWSANCRFLVAHR